MKFLKMKNSNCGRFLIVFGALALIAIGWSARSLVGFKVERPPAPATKIPCVRLVCAKEIPFNPVSEYVGHVVPVEETDILPQVEGYVRKVCFREGSTVAAGDLLFEIDAEPYEAVCNLRHSEVRSAESKMVVAQSEVDRAERYHRRLAAADDRGVTATERDTAETTLASARAQLKAAQAAVEQAKAAAEVADYNLKHTKVYAPIPGRIGKAFHHVGDYVSPSKSALAKIVRLSPIRVMFPVPDRECRRWWTALRADDMRIRLRLPDGELYGLEGVLSFGDNELSRESGTLSLYADFENPDGELLPNAYVRILADLKNPPLALALPSSCVEVLGETRRIWKVGSGDTVSPVEVSVGAEFGDQIEILKGAVSGDRIVSAGAFKLSPGCRVEVIE